jgi:20S proteasome alpha/beta subunit
MFRRVLVIIMVLLFGGGAFLETAVAQSVPVETRHSFSLTTFDTNGRLDQVEYALVAASLGTPIVGVIMRTTRRSDGSSTGSNPASTDDGVDDDKTGGDDLGDAILLASPQILPSPLMSDDGTTRFARVSPNLALGHTGIAADGRVVVGAAQRLAIEHAYTYDEPIPLGIFLEEISLLFQSYTTKPGVRPFGCTLLVAYLPPASSSSSDADSSSGRPRLFRMDCSGAVEELTEVAVINGKSLGDSMKPRLLDLARKGEFDTRRKQRRAISDILQEALREGVKSKNKRSKDGNQDDVKLKLPLRIISASFDRDRGLVVERSFAETSDSTSIKAQ